MRKSFEFLKQLYKLSIEDNILAVANELTYKLLFALFPMIIFNMSLLGYFNIDASILFETVNRELPDEITSIFSLFVQEVINVKSPKILSGSLLVSIVSASSGFNAVIRAINRSYDCVEKRNAVQVRLISILLVLVFTISIFASALLLIFGDTIKKMLLEFPFMTYFSEQFYSFTTYILMLLSLVAATVLIYKVSASRKTSILSVLPGACTTVACWVIASKGFNIYVNNFSKYSKVYGSIGGIFILMVWLNLISFVLLLGTEINALIEVPQLNKKSAMG